MKKKWQTECDYIASVIEHGGRVKEMAFSLDTFISYCELQETLAARECSGASLDELFRLRALIVDAENMRTYRILWHHPTYEPKAEVHDFRWFNFDLGFDHDDLAEMDALCVGEEVKWEGITVRRIS